MLFATLPRLSHTCLFALLVVFASLTSGCQSSRPSFSFQPAPGRLRLVPSAVEPFDSLVAITTLAPAASVFPARNRAPRQAQTQVREVSMVAVPTAIANTDKRTVVRPMPTRRRALLTRPHATAEVGLGTTVLGVLGLVLLPIALIGLLLSGGGLVWGIVAGLAALAVLVAYLDPFGR